MLPHVLSVHDGKPCKCDICDYSFSQKGNMNNHVASVDDRKNPFKCEMWL